jgi:hypothetical protein
MFVLGPLMFSALFLGCGVSEEDVGALKARLALVEASAQDYEARLNTIENGIKGVGFVGLRHRWDPKWIAPKVKCRGPEATPRDFKAIPAAICVSSGFRRSVRPTVMRIQVRSLSGDIVFKEKVAWNEERKAFCFDVLEHNCDGIHSIGIGTSPPTLKAL